VLPARLGALTGAMADVLEVHTQALDLTDPKAEAEREVYADLVDLHREIAGRLQAAADRMAGSRALAMGKHDPDAMSAAEPRRAFEALVKTKQDLFGLLQDQAESDRQMLAQMHGVIDAGG
jgi:hypothetical protein